MTAAAAPAPDLELTDLRVTFGGLTAVAGLSLHAPSGQVTGLIGPNGAGKTTTFQATTGVVSPASGSVRLGDHVLDGASPAARAQLGLGRTFQRIELWDSMTVVDNVALGYEARSAGRRPWRQLWETRAERAEAADRAEVAMARCGITALARRSAADLSTGHRRLVELARALAGGFPFLLLDEPSAGLDHAETDRIASVLDEVVAADGTGILLVEHDMALVQAVCASVYVLDFGRLIHEGPTAEVLASDVVRAAYLGHETLIP